MMIHRVTYTLIYSIPRGSSRQIPSTILLTTLDIQVDNSTELHSYWISDIILLSTDPRPGRCWRTRRSSRARCWCSPCRAGPRSSSQTRGPRTAIIIIIIIIIIIVLITCETGGSAATAGQEAGAGCCSPWVTGSVAPVLGNPDPGVVMVIIVRNWCRQSKYSIFLSAKGPVRPSKAQ